MILKNTLTLLTKKSNLLTFRFLPNGDLFDIMHQNTQINLQKGNIVDGSLSNIYLRDKTSNHVYPLLSSPFIHQVYEHENGMIYEGKINDIDYSIILNIHDQSWTYDVSLQSDRPYLVDLFYGQDVGIQDINGILNNEAYIVQYIDYKVFNTARGYTLCARQNQGQPAYFQMGMREKTVAYATDAMQFFKTQQKADNHIYALDEPLLESKIYQYESSYLTLQSESFKIHQQPKTCQFYGYFEPNHPEAITKPKNISLSEPIIIAKNSIKRYECVLKNAPFISGNTLSDEQLKALYPKRCFEENRDGLKSWFLEDYTHVMTKQKELDLERSQGHILMQGDIINASEHVMSTTAYMNGVFMSHVALGNTSFHKMLGDHRHPLMHHRMAGLRIYIKQDSIYTLLTTPSVFEVSHQHAKWIYVFDDDTLTISLFGDVNLTEIHLSVESSNHKSYDMLYSLSLLMGPQEWLYDLDLVTHDRGFEITMPDVSMAHPVYPNLTYGFQINTDQHVKFVGDGLITGEFTLNEPVLLKVSAAYGKPTFHNFSINDAISSGHSFYQSLMKHIQGSLSDKVYPEDEPMLYWYIHNALIHYASPHGLEQYNGAAWGTRDVCQGPFELFSALQMDDQLKHILLTVYSRQFLETGDFPQWFMYDKYEHIQAHESHGDIIFWPLKALGYYLKQTGDYTILDETVSYYSLEQHIFIKGEPLIQHVKKQIDAMLTHTIEQLPIYGGGDWDDTLQPANNTLKERMVSGWTAALMIQTLESFADEIKLIDQVYAEFLWNETAKVKNARKQFLIPQNIPAGFAVFNQPITYLLHPSDTESGLKYRLLPFIRSMIAGLTTKEENQSYLNIIDTYLKHPDGVRLMNEPVRYQGGLKTHFNRAETAANFGREIGLQYVHAHIRYMEAMFVIGERKRALDALHMIHPIVLNDYVSNALPRQRNAYYSSSDGAFYDRYEAKLKFDTLRSGETPVKGGWRIYSSGPGILIHQMIVHLYNIQRNHQSNI